MTTPWLSLLEGDALATLKTLPTESVHCCVTSPPYWGLRDYGTATWQGGEAGHEHVGSVQRTMPPGSAKQASNTGASSVRSGDCLCGATRVDAQLGLEASPEEFVDRLVEVCREVRRVLRKDGTFWLNLGDSYGGDKPGGRNDVDRMYHTPADALRSVVGTERRVGVRLPGSVKPKDMVGIPWRVAFALQADGWYLRADIIWAKPNPMPESVTDRPTKAHEYLFLLSKSARYYYDAEAIKEPVAYGEPNSPESIKSPYGQGFARKPSGWDAGPGNHHGIAGRYGSGNKERKLDVPTRPNDHRGSSIPWQDDGRGRNKRSVWEIATQPYAEAHFATFPPGLVQPCILAGSSDRGCCATCGAPWSRVLELTPEYRALLESGKAWRDDSGKPDAYTNRQPADHPSDVPPKYATLGWQATCDHEGEPTACTVLDPFLGSGTTAFVANELGRRAIGIELNPEYLTLARKRCMQLTLWEAGEMVVDVAP